MDGEKPKKERTEAQKRLNKSLSNTKELLKAAGKQWHPSKAPAIAKLLREGAAKANIDAKISELEDKAVKEEKKAVKAAAASASAAAAGNAVASAEKAAEAAGAAAAAGVLKAAAKAGKTQRERTNKEKAVNELRRMTAKAIRNAGKKWSPKSAAAVFKALKAGNDGGANAILSTMANAANKTAAAVGNAAAGNGAAAPGAALKAWKANLNRARNNIQRNFGKGVASAANIAKYASALKKGNNAGAAAIKNALTAKKAAKNAKKPAGNNKTKKNVATSPMNFKPNYTYNNQGNFF